MNKKSKVLFISMLVNTFLSIMKIIGGILGHSRTVIVDGIHSLSDMVTDIFSIMGMKLSLKPADKEHPFGHGKLENVISLFIGILIIFIGVIVLKNSFYSKAVIPSIYLIILILVTIGLKYLLSNYVYKKGIEYDSPILVSSGKESRMDVISSLFALLIIFLSNFSFKFEFLRYLDIFGGIIISFFIIYTGLNIIKEEASFLIGKEETDKELVKLLKDKCEEIKVKDVKTLKYGSKYLVFASIYLDNKLSFIEAHNIRDSLEKKLLKEKNIERIIIKMIPTKEV